MAIAASAIWRIRPGGNVLNGAVYDGTTYAGGTDFSQQDAAQLSLTDAVGNGTTTLTSAAAGFTSAMVGNGVNLTSGTGVTVGFYLIASFTNTTTVVLDRIPGTFTGGVGRVGGAWGGATQHPFQLGNSGPVPGNTIYIRGAGTNTPATADYTFSGYYQTTPGDTTTGRISWLAENGRPRLHSNGIVLYNVAQQRFVGMYFYATSNSNGASGVINIQSSSVENCVINTNSQTNTVGLIVAGGNGGEVINCEIFSGTTSPTSAAGCHGILVSGGLGVKILGNRIHHCRDGGIVASGSPQSTIANNWIYGNVGDGFFASESAYGTSVANNTFHGNGGHGLTLGVTGTLSIYSVYGNIFSGHTGTGKFGVNIAAGTAAVVAATRRFFDYNTYYNNTAHRSTNLALGTSSQDITVDPYTAASTFDFSLNATTGGGAAVRAAGFPAVFGTYPITGLTRANYPDGGASQHADPAGGGGGGGGGVSFFGGM